MYQLGVDVSVVGTSPIFDLGQMAFNDTGSGALGYVYVSFPVSTALAIGDVVLFNGSGASSVCNTTTTTPGDAAGRRVGVVVATVASNASLQYGWVQVYGLSSVNGAASCVRNTVLNTTATSGRLDDDATAGSEVIDGIVFNTTLTGAAVTAATLNFPHVGRTL